MKYEIKNRYTNVVIVDGEAENFKTFLEGAIDSGADLIRADLTRADLTGASLYDCIGNKKQIKSCQIETYSIAYTSDRLQIGCENHSVVDWRRFDDNRISNMDLKAVEWWTKWKVTIFKIIELSPAEKTLISEVSANV